MKKENVLQELSMALLALLLAACVTQREEKIVYVPTQPEPVHYEVYSPGENLSALTKITKGDYVCEFPHGGDNGANLFFSGHTSGSNYSNIYKKESTSNSSMSQKTSGKNHNMAPTYCAATNMMAYSGRSEGAAHRDLYMVNASQGGALTQITSTLDADENYPSISRDGKKIVYQMLTAGKVAKSTEIWLKNLQTNEEMMLGLGLMPTFSPDGRTIAYIQFSADGMHTSLWTMTANGENKMQITDSNIGSVQNPCFSPDGTKIVFQCQKPEKADFDLYVIDRNGNNLQQLSVNSSYDGEPYWSKDGYIYFTSDRGSTDKHYQIWRFKFGTVTTFPDTPIVDENEVSSPIPTNEYHTVRQGETISQIASRFGTTVSNIVKWNNLQTMTVTAGQRLRVKQ